MNIIEGDLRVMALPELMRWIDANGKTGSLLCSNGGVEKAFFFERGKIVFLSSRKPGEQIGTFLAETGKLDEAAVQAALQESSRLGIPFTSYLISMGLIEEAWLRVGLEDLAGRVLSDALTWDSGSFVLLSELPEAVARGPIMLETSSLVARSLASFRDAPPGKAAAEGSELCAAVVKSISEENIELPVLPDMMYRLNGVISSEQSSIQDVARVIMSDQVLTAKILKVSNSVFYSAPHEVTSLQQAIITMGFKTVQSIAAIHALSRLCTRNTGRLRDLLRHSLLCAFIAKGLAADLRLDPEAAFVCGLLHDIGKTVLLNAIDTSGIPEAMVSSVLAAYHEQIGSLLVRKWNLSDAVEQVVHFHHHPALATSHESLVETVFLADGFAHAPDPSVANVVGLHHIDIRKVRAEEICASHDQMKGLVGALI